MRGTPNICVRSIGICGHGRAGEFLLWTIPSTLIYRLEGQIGEAEYVLENVLHRQRMVKRHPPRRTSASTHNFARKLLVILHGCFEHIRTSDASKKYPTTGGAGISIWWLLRIPSNLQDDCGGED